jgi:hypothetical protein
MVLNRLFLSRASLSQELVSTPSGTFIVCPDSSVGRILVSKTSDRGSSPPRVPINSTASYMTYLITYKVRWWTKSPRLSFITWEDSLMVKTPVKETGKGVRFLNSL